MERTPHTRSPRNSTEQLPKVQVQSHNLQYARLLMDDYAGPDGELTAILTYNYQNTCLFCSNTPMWRGNWSASPSRKCTICTHWGTVIHQLKADPRYRASHNHRNGRLLYGRGAVV